MTETHTGFQDAFGGYYALGIIFLLAAAVFVPLFHRLKISIVLGFLLVGVMMGPAGLGRLADQWPLLQLYGLSSLNQDTAESNLREGFIHDLAELGVVFLLFQIGLELTWERIKSMRRMIVGLGATQVLGSITVLAVLFLSLGQSLAGAVAVAMALALSSTAVVMPVLAERKRLNSGSGRAIFSVLLAQDMAVAPIMITVAVLATGGGGFGINGVLALIGGLIGMGVLVLGGRGLMRPLFNGVARLKSRELFMAACLLVILVSGRLAVMGGLSMGLGAFVAGVLLAETEFRREIEDMIEPFKGLLLGLFFMTVGARLDLMAVLAEPWLIFGLVLGVIGIKALLVFALARRFGLSRAQSLETAAYLGPAGEFAFVILDQAMGLKLIKPGFGEQVLLAAIISLFLIPLLAYLVEIWLRKVESPAKRLTEAPDSVSGLTDVLVVGYGRVGGLVVEMLQRHNLKFIIVDSNPKVCEKARKDGLEAWYGDAARLDFLNRLGLKRVRAVVVTVSNAGFTDAVVQAVRSQRSDISLIARARDARHAEKLYELGVTDAVPETIEASLQLAENLLVDLGIPMGHVLTSVHEKRDEFRQRFLAQISHAQGVVTQGHKQKGIRAVGSTARRAQNEQPD
jgi:monovalent cation:H+ antiporter-2, CPA2 family